MISRTVEYALRATVSLASDPQSPRTTRQLAELTQVPPSYLSKVMQLLVDAGIVTSQRGLGGGFVLAREPNKLTVLDVVNAVDPIERIRACPLKLSSHAMRLCPLHQRLDDALAIIERVFGDSTIADMLSGDRPEQPLCPAPPIAARPAASGNLAGPRPADAAGRRPRTRRARPQQSR